MKVNKFKEIAGGILGLAFFALLIAGYIFFFGTEKIYVGFANTQPGVYEARFPCKPESKEIGTWVTASCVDEDGNGLSITSAPTSEIGKASDNPEGGIEVVEKVPTKLNGYDSFRFITKYNTGYTRFYKVEHNNKTIIISIEVNSASYSNNFSEPYSKLLESFKLLD